MSASGQQIATAKKVVHNATLPRSGGRCFTSSAYWNAKKQIATTVQKALCRIRYAVMAWILLALPCLAVDVSTLATGGTGTSASPWTGWETTAWQAETEYKWPSGVYAWSAPLNLLQTGIAHVGQAGTVLKFTGSGNAVSFDNPGGFTPGYLNWTQNVRFENFIIQGTAAATNGLFMRGVRNAVVKHVSVRDVPNACLLGQALVTNIFDNFRCTHHEMPGDMFAVRPKYGAILGSRGADTTTTSLFNNAVIEGVGVVADNSGIGIWVQAGSYGNRFVGGTSEGNYGKGMQLDSWANVVDGMDFEVNQSTDIEVNHSSNRIWVPFSGGLIDVKAGQLNKIGGRGTTLKIANICDQTDIVGIYLSGVLTDLSLSTTRFAYQTGAGMQFQSRIGKVNFGP